MSDELTSLAARFGRYLDVQMPHASDVRIESIARIHGGASRETYRCRAVWTESGQPIERGLILRRDPIGSLIETERDIEFLAYRAFRNTDVPVPAALFLETDPRWLDRPFFVMELIEGSAANPFQPLPYSPHEQRLGAQFWRALGGIARLEPHASELAGRLAVPSPNDCWREQLDYWEGVVDGDEMEPQPILRGAIRWLRRNPPPPPSRVAVVHGDFRSGNFLFDGAGNLRAILDWEMCHLGDPHEDLGWACDPLWSNFDPEKPAQLIDKQQGLAIWEETSGLKINPDSLRWWEIFAHVKGLAIWISGSKEYITGANKDPVLLLSGWLCTERHNRILSERMRQLDAATA